jgi:UDP-N-acetylmuramoyl-L-alanyl-D-glutamate--2,6-diaminopimelate ligase
MKLKDFIPLFLINWYHFALAFLGALIYGFPSKRLKVIGVTGTKGKSTTIELARTILENAGHKVASASSIKFKIGQEEELNKLKMTMPGRFKLQKFLKKAVSAGCEYAILEVTSEGILQHREKFIDFDVVVFTNLAPEHIERHGSFKQYREAKEILFRECKKLHIINVDDENSKYFLKFHSQQKFCYSINSKLENKSWKFITADNLNILEDKIEFKVNNVQFNLNLPGKFNIYNSLTAITIASSQGVSLETCKKALEKIKEIPGRMETIVKKPFKVVIDYAHTPDSLEQVYKTLSNGSKLICVLGSCGGGRDKWKRPKIGEIAARYCDKIILTNEDPYDENPSQILSEIKSGIPNTKDNILSIILDRKEAIIKVLRIAEETDTVIITGKGSEPWMCVANNKKIPWSDKEIVKQGLLNEVVD